jgi:hypothetical protein
MRMRTKFGVENLKGRYHFDFLGAGRITLIWMLAKSSVGWLHRGQDRDQWRALVNIEMKLRFP